MIDLSEFETEEDMNGLIFNIKDTSYKVWDKLYNYENSADYKTFIIGLDWLIRCEIDSVFEEDVILKYLKHPNYKNINPALRGIKLPVLELNIKKYKILNPKAKLYINFLFDNSLFYKRLSKSKKENLNDSLDEIIQCFISKDYNEIQVQINELSLNEDFIKYNIQYILLDLERGVV